MAYILILNDKMNIHICGSTSMNVLPIGNVLEEFIIKV